LFDQSSKAVFWVLAAARHRGAMIRDRADESERERPSAQRRLVARAAEISLRR